MSEEEKLRLMSDRAAREKAYHEATVANALAHHQAKGNPQSQKPKSNATTTITEYETKVDVVRPNQN